MIFFAAVFLSPTAQWTLSSRSMQWLGRLSFSIYLLHWPIMMSVGAIVYVHAFSMGPETAWLLAMIVGGATTLLAASVFERVVDNQAISLSRFVAASPSPVVLS